MSQQYYFENELQQTINFSNAQVGDMFIYSGDPYIRLDNNNPNAAKLENGEIKKMNDEDQIILPTTRLIKFD